MTPATLPDASTESAPQRYSFSIEEYLQLFEKGILAPDLRTELIDGEIIQMTPPGPEHSSFVLIASEFLRRCLPSDWYVATEIVVKLGTHLPVPDITVFQGHPLDYANQYLTADKIGVLIEVSKSSLNYDLDYKARLYATHGVQQYIVVDIDRREMMFFQNPGKAKYGKKSKLKLNEQLTMQLAGTPLSFSLSDLLKR
ncbi:Uma2 family endonuclease [Lacunimicrobium album]